MTQLTRIIEKNIFCRKIRNNDTRVNCKTIDFMKYPSKITLHPLVLGWFELGLFFFLLLASSSGFVRLVSRVFCVFFLFSQPACSPFPTASPLFRFFLSYAFLLPLVFHSCSMLVNTNFYLFFQPYFYSNYCSTSFFAKDSPSIRWDSMVLVSSLR